jgi:hypothetical protein
VRVTVADSVQTIIAEFSLSWVLLQATSFRNENALARISHRPRRAESLVYDIHTTVR